MTSFDSQSFAAEAPGSGDGGSDGVSYLAVQLRRWAERKPHASAVRSALPGGGWRELDFAALDEGSDRLAHALAARGVRPGDRTCVFVRTGPELLATTYALFKLGAVPVLVDPGMGRRRLLACVERIRPRALVGVPAALLARRVFRRAFKSVEIAHAIERAGAASRRASAPPFPVEPVPRDAEAAILFTSGSTGPAKGALYTHANFRAQLTALKSLYGLAPGEVDVACFPLFALFDTALGLTSVFPEMDPSRPAECDPRKVVLAIVENDATLSFGSPAVWRRVLPWLEQVGQRLPKLARVLVAGAPVSPALAHRFRNVLSGQADVHTPYGATEALPVTTISGREIALLRERAETGEGTCVGRVAPGIDLRLIRIDDEPIDAWDDDLVVPQGEPGEICVRGAVVTRAYAEEPEHTRAAKILHADGSVWHRMGDIGHLDADGRLWFLGRKAHRIETARGTLMPVPQENIFDTHPLVRRSALVGVGRAGAAQPVLVVETERKIRGKAMRRALALEIAAHRSGLARRVTPRAVLFHKSFPVDPRHNSKIHRRELGQWAARALR